VSLSANFDDVYVDAAGDRAPSIAAFSPATGWFNTGVRIEGFNFVGATAVTNSNSTFTVIRSAPTINSFTPTSGPAGSAVELHGAGFTGTTSMAFNGSNAAYTVDSDSVIHATVPAGATSGKVTVTTPTGTATSASNFTVIPPPKITGFTPTYGRVGREVTISGSNFTNVTAVKLSTTRANFSVSSSTVIKAVVPALVRGELQVVRHNGLRNGNQFELLPGPLVVVGVQIHVGAPTTRHGVHGVRRAAKAYPYTS
jgi:hypothetical protein